MSASAGRKGASEVIKVIAFVIIALLIVMIGLYLAGGAGNTMLGASKDLLERIPI